MTIMYVTSLHHVYKSSNILATQTMDSLTVLQRLQLTKQSVRTWPWKLSANLSVFVINLIGLSNYVFNQIVILLEITFKEWRRLQRIGNAAVNNKHANVSSMQSRHSELEIVTVNPLTTTSAWKKSVENLSSSLFKNKNSSHKVMCVVGINDALNTMKT